jgi:hypothetical protein
MAEVTADLITKFSSYVFTLYFTWLLSGIQYYMASILTNLIEPDLLDIKNSG